MLAVYRIPRLLAVAQAVALSALLANPVASQTPSSVGSTSMPSGQTPAQLQGVDISQKLGESVPLDAEFTDADGRRVRLGDLLGDRPVVLALVYYECPMLCNLILDRLSATLRTVSLEAGQDFDVVVASFDPGETPQMASEAKSLTLNRYERETDASAWHFLVGAEPEIDRLTESVGFQYSYDERTDEYAHSSALIVLTPDGRASRYFFGLDFPPRDVRLGLVEASNNQIGNPVDQLLLLCLRYDPASGKYSATVIGILRIAAALTVVGLIALFVVLSRSKNDENENHTRQSPVGAA